MQQWLIKSLLFLLFFAAVIGCIRWLQSPAGKLLLRESVFFGEDRRLNLCPGRIRSITWPDGVRLEETQQKQSLKAVWQGVSEGKGAKTVKYLEIERWLSLHCINTTIPVAQEHAPPTPEAVLHFEYVDGQSKDLQQGGSLFRWADAPGSEWVRSEALEQALKDLHRLVQSP